MTINEVIAICRTRVQTREELATHGVITLGDPVAEWVVATFCHDIKHPKDGTVTIQFGLGVVELFDADGAYTPDDAKRLAHDLVHYAEEASDHNG